MDECRIGMIKVEEVKPIHEKEASDKSYMCKLTSKTHFLREPKLLPCGLSACLECIKNVSGTSHFFKCPKCDAGNFIPHPSNLPMDEKSVGLIKADSKAITNEIVEQLRKKIYSLQETQKNIEPCMENHYDFMKQEVLIKIESIKIELDNLLDRVTNRLDDEKVKNKVYLENMNSRIDENINQSNRIIEKLLLKTSPDEHDVYHCEENLRNLSDYETKLINLIHGIKFEPADDEICEEIIGKISINGFEILETERHAWNVFNFSDEYFDTEFDYSGDDDDDDDDEFEDDDDEDEWSDVEDEDDDFCSNHNGIDRVIMNLIRNANRRRREGPSDEDFANFFSQDKEDRDYAAFFGGYGCDDDYFDDDDDDDDIPMFSAKAMPKSKSSNAKATTKTGSKKGIKKNGNACSAVTGRVKWFDEIKGYGFIHRNDNDQDIFVHHSDVNPLIGISQNDNVKFSIGMTPKGPKAINVNFC